ncbi:MAG: dTDP-4-dehydrorhamnose reductase [Saprospiraceae bacterium]|nr:dTDP-4-dehydrorhamnose reductase [Saprospiraceae bacterium]
MESKTIIVAGANGQLGKSFQKIVFDWQEYNFHFFDSNELDITNKNALEHAFSSLKPSVFINCAAYTAVDKAESERERAYAINSEALDYITLFCIKNNTLLIHYSSDYVYDNGMKVPMGEEAPTSPKSIYAQSKKMGEEIIERSPVNALLIRTSWVYSEFGHNFVKTMLKLGKEKSILNVVNDQIGSPTYAGDLANATMKMIDQYAKKPFTGIEIYNYSGEGKISWFEFASFIFEVAELDIDVHPIPTSDYKTPATRPKWSVLDLSKIKKEYGIAPKYWKESVRECLYLLS